MTDLLTCVRGKLDDPSLMDWALHHYEDTQSHDPILAHQMEQAWFDNLTLRRWIKSDDHYLLTRMFGHLPVECFVNIHMAIFEQWPQWSGSLAYQSAPVLTTCDPEQSASLFMKHLDHDFGDAYKTMAVIEQLSNISKVDAHRLLVNVTDKILARDD